MSEQMLLYSAVKDFKTKAGACQYYRIEVPFQAMHDLGLARVFIDDGGFSPELGIQNMFSADIDLIYALSGKGVSYILDELKKLKPGLAMDGETMRYPPSVVFDMDDNLDWVHPFNPAFDRFGFHAPDGTEMAEGDKVTVLLPDGREIDLWEDKKTEGERGQIFDVTANKKLVKDFHALARRCDGHTFPSKFLGKFYEENYGVKNWYYFPNSVIPEHYPKVDIVPHDYVRVLWQGGSSHAPDWYPIQDAFVEAMRKHPTARFLQWGAQFYAVKERLLEGQYETLPWMNYPGYKPMRTIVDADINLCPLVDNAFNKSKSAIKWYEGSILHRPEATLAAKVAPYSDEIVDGETGLLYDTPNEFQEKLDLLIKDKDLRLRLAENAKKWVIENRDARKTVLGLFDYYKELRERKIAEHAGTLVVPAGEGNGSL